MATKVGIVHLRRCVSGIAVTFAQYPMNIRLARSLIATLGDDPCIFGYSGRFPDEHSPRLIELGEAIHSSCAGPQSAKGRLGYVMVEAYQNMVRHRARIEEAVPHHAQSLFMLRCHGRGHVLETRNPVTHAQQPPLEARLAALRGKDTSELKELFLEGIQRVRPPGMRGAGLGLIEMVRRAGANPTWSFERLNETHALFHLSLELGERDPGKVNDHGLPGLMWAHEIACCYAGVWSEGIQRALIGLVPEERPARNGDMARAAELATRVADALFATVVPGEPHVLIFHGGEHPALVLGGVVDPGLLNAFMADMQDAGVRVAHGPGLSEGSVLATAHIPW